MASSQMLLFLDSLYTLPHDPYRELLASIDRILGFAYSEVAITGMSILECRVSEEMKKRLDNVILVTFNSKWALPSTFSFIQQFEKPFQNDFASTFETSDGVIPNEKFPDSLQELVQRLLLWKQFLLNHIRNSKNPDFLFHSKFLPNYLEIPGKYLSFHSIYQISSTIQSLSPHQPQLYLESHGWRHCSLTDEKNRVWRFYLEQVIVADLIVEERTLAQQLYFEQLCMSSHPVQSRHLHASIPCYVNIGPTVRLVRTDVNAVNLEGVYREALKEEYDEKQLVFALRLFYANHPDFEPPDSISAIIKSVPREKLFDSVLSDDTLTSFVYDMLTIGTL